MPVSIALAWVKFGGVVIGLRSSLAALFVPRPGANAFWGDVPASSGLSAAPSQPIRFRAQSPRRRRRAGPETKPARQKMTSRPPAIPGPPDKSQFRITSTRPRPRWFHSQVRRRLTRPRTFIQCCESRIVRRRGIDCCVGGWCGRAICCLKCSASVRGGDPGLFPPASRPCSRSQTVQAGRPAGAPRVRSVRWPNSRTRFLRTRSTAARPQKLFFTPMTLFRPGPARKGSSRTRNKRRGNSASDVGEKLPELAATVAPLVLPLRTRGLWRTSPGECDLEPLKEIWRRLTWS